MSDGKTAQKKERKTEVWPCDAVSIMQYCTTMLYASRYDLNTPTIKALQWIDVNPSPNPLDSLLPADIYIKAVS